LKFSDVGDIPITGSVPVPLRAIVRGEPAALLVIDTLPLTLVPVVGAKVTLKEVLWPGLSV